MSDSFDLNEITELLKVLKKYDVGEFELRRGEEKLSLRRGDSDTTSAKANRLQAVQHHYVAPTPYPSPPVLTPNAPIPSSEAAPPVETQPIREVPTSSESDAKDVVSPMVGTFYRRPAVDADPYVEVGDTVKKGDVLCIVEAMKLMNEIESDISGKIVEICLEDAQMVEFGEVLFRIEPGK